MNLSFYVVTASKPVFMSNKIIIRFKIVTILQLIVYNNFTIFS